MSAPPTAARAPVRHERTPAAARHPDTPTPRHPERTPAAACAPVRHDATRARASRTTRTT
ncbi:hypothetical protein AB0H65_14340 [Streptomyces griseoaurantiacus]|uniref:hypothetical protein n=1 Tax=Streptomyces griseoaurantiacus TaxID=68213 RepID=UPI0034600EC4